MIHLQLKTLSSTFGACLALSTLIKQVASNKSSLLLKIKKWNTQILQLFTEVIKTESIYKSH